VQSLNNAAGIDLTNGITIRNGDNSITLNFASAQTFQDIINTINASGMGIKAKINSQGTGIDITNEVAGARLSIGENGGTTADDLGIRTFRPETLLADLNEGIGVHTGTDDGFQIVASNGATVDVNLSGAKTVQDVIDRTNAAAAAAGVQIQAGFAKIGNGIVLTDNTGGTGTFQVVRLNLSDAASDLGILKTADAGTNQITGNDVNPQKDESIFTYLIDLREGLKTNDVSKMETAAKNIENYMEDLNKYQGKLGFMAKGLELRKTRTEDAILSTKTLLSGIKDLDYTESILKFQNLQTALQANLQSAGQILQTSLLDFLS